MAWGAGGGGGDEGVGPAPQPLFPGPGASKSPRSLWVRENRPPSFAADQGQNKHRTPPPRTKTQARAPRPETNDLRTAALRRGSGQSSFLGGGGAGGTRPRYLIVCLWQRPLASRPLLILTLCGSERGLVVSTENRYTCKPAGVPDGATCNTGLQLTGTLCTLHTMGGAPMQWQKTMKSELPDRYAALQRSGPRKES